MKSKTKIDEQLGKKTNPELVATILEAKKKKNWLEIAGLISSPRANMSMISIDRLDKEAKDGETIIVPGKVLSQGELNKKIKVVALGFSEMARKKIATAKGETSNILEEIKRNPDAKGMRILK
jgi:large subunit ribosomal protein L18e